MIYQLINGELKPSISRSGKCFDTKSSDQRKRQNQKRNHDRNRKIYAYYQSTKWKKLSKYIREHEPLCRACINEHRNGKRKLTDIQLATSVDHIVPIKTIDGYRKRNNIDNLQPLCSLHHKNKNKHDHALKIEI